MDYCEAIHYEKFYKDFEKSAQKPIHQKNYLLTHEKLRKLPNLWPLNAKKKNSVDPGESIHTVLLDHYRGTCEGFEKKSF